MKKVNLSSPVKMFLIGIIALMASCSEAPQQEQQVALSAPPPPTAPPASLLATDVHSVTFKVLDMLATGYTTCNCDPNLDNQFFGAFVDTTSLHNMLASGTTNGICMHTCLSDAGNFYIALSEAASMADSTLIPTTDYKTAASPFTYSGSSVEAFIDATAFNPSNCSTMRGSVITADRQRLANTLTCDLNGDGTQDPLSTVPVSFINKNQLQQLMDQCVADKIGLLMGFDPTSSPNVMRILMMSTYTDMGQTKLMKLAGAGPDYALMLDRGRP